MAEMLPDVLRHAEAAYDSIRAINHVTPPIVTAPTVYDVLGNLKGVGNMLPQALIQLAAALGRANDEYETYEDDGGHSAKRTATAQKHLMRAAELADQLGDELDAAQSSISHQGFRTT
jgi:hypothetical protein